MVLGGLWMRIFFIIAYPRIINRGIPKGIAIPPGPWNNGPYRITTEAR
jgi:hypothetical protein